MLRFNAVTIDFRNGVIKFNPKKRGSNCVPMELLVDRNRLVSGIVAHIEIEGNEFRAKIDSGANVDVLIHGVETLPHTKFSEVSNLRMFDRSGNLARPEQAIVSTRFGTKGTRNTALRVPFQHGDFNATLGSKFFSNRILTFNFDKQRLCLD
jgi:hypothetical protein